MSTTNEFANEHYQSMEIDTVKFSKANDTLVEQKAICRFNLNKYNNREKGQNLDDIKKIKFYTRWLEEVVIKQEEELKPKEKPGLVVRGLEDTPMDKHDHSNLKRFLASFQSSNETEEVKPRNEGSFQQKLVKKIKEEEFSLFEKSLKTRLESLTKILSNLLEDISKGVGLDNLKPSVMVKYKEIIDSTDTKLRILKHKESKAKDSETRHVLNKELQYIINHHNRMVSNLMSSI